MRKKETIQKTKIPKAITITAMILGTIIILALIGISTLNKETTQTIKVTGTASINAIPDEINLHLNIETQGENAKEAKDKNTAILNTVTTALLATGYQQEEIQTTNFNIWEEYDWTEKGRTPIGYKATHNIKIRIPENNKIAETIDAGVNAGANINHLSFTLSQEKENEYKTQTIEEATKNAKEQAEAIAKGLGTKLGKIITLTNTEFNYHPWPIYETTTLQKADSQEEINEIIQTEINPREQKITSSITATYKIR